MYIMVYLYIYTYSYTCVCRYICVLYAYIFLYMLVTTINENLKENKKRYIGGFGRNKGKGKTMWLYYNLKNKKNNIKRIMCYFRYQGSSQKMVTFAAGCILPLWTAVLGVGGKLRSGYILLSDCIKQCFPNWTLS